MREMRQLVSVLERELRLQEELLTILASERAAIVSMNNDQLGALASEKEQILNKASFAETERSRLMNEIGAADKKLPEIITGCKDDAIRGQLGKVRDELKVVATRVAEMNRHNGELLRQSLGLVVSAISILRGGANSKPMTYGANGRQESSGTLGPVGKPGSVRKEA